MHTEEEALLLNAVEHWPHNNDPYKGETMSDKPTKKEWIIATVFVIFVSILTSVFVFSREVQPPPPEPICHDEIMPISQDGQSVLKLPEGWHYLDTMDGMILVKREVCE